LVDNISCTKFHFRSVETTLEALQVPLRLECGDTILIDNHRVLHGRYAFQGRRNLIGCYLTADDWRSKLRVLETAARVKQRLLEPPS
jgi:trimethyllysine dioxygenase